MNSNYKNSLRKALLSKFSLLIFWIILPKLFIRFLLLGNVCRNINLKDKIFRRRDYLVLYRKNIDSTKILRLRLNPKFQILSKIIQTKVIEIPIDFSFLCWLQTCLLTVTWLSYRLWTAPTNLTKTHGKSIKAQNCIENVEVILIFILIFTCLLTFFVYLITGTIQTT